MSLMKSERSTMSALLPGLDEKLAALSLADLERKGNPGLTLFREAGGPALLIPRELGGRGATPFEALHVQRAIGSRSPSLAVASTMHHFSVATLLEFSVFGSDEACRSLLEAIAAQNLLLASGFAEGRSGSHILAPTLDATQTADGGYLLNGSKKPCSLSQSMDFLTASVVLNKDAQRRRAVALVPTDLPGIERRPFWRSDVLTGAESEEVVLHDVHIPADCLFFPSSEAALDPVETSGYLWFQVLVSASYVGAATALVERVFAARKGGAVEQAQLASEVEAAMSGLEGIAFSLMAGLPRDALLPRALLVRYAVQGALERACMLATEVLGGVAFIGGPDAAYLLSTSRALAFHPPSRFSSAPALAGYLAGQSLGTA